jgi:hypothetical protein
MPKRTKLKPDFRLWLKKLDRLNRTVHGTWTRATSPSAPRQNVSRSTCSTRAKDDMTKGGPNGSSALPLQSLPYYLAS